jgi:hypothetical protein
MQNFGLIFNLYIDSRLSTHVDECIVANQGVRRASMYIDCATRSLTTGNLCIPISVAQVSFLYPFHVSKLVARSDSNNPAV